VLILSKEQNPNLDEIEKAREEIERQTFDMADFVSKNLIGCSSLL